MTDNVWAVAPEDQAIRSGCKVSWRYYDTKKDAELAAKAATHNAIIQSRLGYDFGYCSPGSVRWCEPNSSAQAGENGRWEVCFP